VRRALWPRWRPNPEGELSFFLIAYLLGLLGALLLVHLLQPERESSGSSSRSPVRQDRQEMR
jgi:hypothetical protein